MSVQKNTLIKTYVDDKIGQKLEKQAAKKGLTLNEYVRVVLGEKANEPEKP